MGRGFLALALLCLCALAADKKPADIKILEFSAQRDGATVTIDGSFRVTGQKPIADLVFAFEFFAGGSSPIATKQVQADEPRLAPGDESAFHVAASAPAKASEIKIRAYRNSSLEIQVENAGPHPIGN